MISLIKSWIWKLDRYLPMTLHVEHADGSVQNIGTGNPALTLRFVSRKAYWPLVLNPSLGFGEGYARRDIEVLPENRLYEFLAGLRLASERLGSASPIRPLVSWFQGISPRNGQRASQKNVSDHYDRFHQIVDLITGSTRTYSCPLFDPPDLTLDQAQDAKARATIDALETRPGQHVFEIGCGYGNNARLGAMEYGLNVTALTLSEEQYRFCLDEAQRLGLSSLITLKQDYRELAGAFHHGYSIGMFEHVGRKYWKTFFDTAYRVLRPRGRFLLHTIVQEQNAPTDLFIKRHIFPGSELPTPADVVKAACEAGFSLKRQTSWNKHYHDGLLHWYDNLRKNKDKIYGFYANDKEAEWCYRLWEVYLCGCTVSFIAKNGMNLMHFLFVKDDPLWQPAFANF